MKRPAVFDKIEEAFLTPARKERLAYFKSIPMNRLIYFVGAGGTLFVAIGLLQQMLTQGEKNLFTGFAMGAFYGVMAVSYTMAAARKRILIPIFFAIQMLANHWLAAAIRWLNANSPVAPVPFEAAVAKYVPAILFLITLSYALFLRFIRTEGRFAFRAQTELALAHGIQQTLVPVVDLKTPHCEIYGISRPSDKVGGDLVDALSLPDGGTVAYLADISGHGLQAGILMGMLKTAVRTSLVDSPPPSHLFKTLNRVLPQVKEPAMYATCAAVQLRPGTLKYAVAGHPPILHIAANSQTCARLSDEQFPLGLFSFATYRTQSLATAPGDLFVVSTDGILEVTGKDGVDFGAAPMEAIVTANSSDPLPDLAQKILAGAKEAGSQDDDQTLLLIRIL
jgi:hypothetical protein